jgi:hypothetical protein
MGVSKASLRGLPIDQRMEKMQAANPAKTVRVSPVNDEIRRVLYHPRAGYFPAEGGMEWPDDDFTHRRIRDGDVRADEKQAEPEQQQTQAQHQEKQPEDKQSSRGSAKGAS